LTRRRRDPERTREKILDAATRAFAKDGLAGARIDGIARGARVNKRMLYHYFGSKRGLFEAIVARSARRNRASLDNMGEAPGDLLAAWQVRNSKSLPWIRMLQWEALEAGRGELAAGAERQENAGRIRQRVEGWIASGRAARGLDAGQLQLSLAALTVFPSAFPQITRLITGLAPDDPAFVAERVRFLKRLSALLAGEAKTRARR
jgi:TetR/AcrR family transcriptional regulator